MYLKNVQMLANIPVAIDAPEGATESGRRPVLCARRAGAQRVRKAAPETTCVGCARGRATRAERAREGGA